MWQLCSCPVPHSSAFVLVTVFLLISLCCSVDILGSGIDPEYSLYSSLLRIFIVQMFLPTFTFSRRFYPNNWGDSYQCLEPFTNNTTPSSPHRKLSLSLSLFFSLSLSLAHSSSHAPFSLYLLFLRHVFCIQTIPDVFIRDIFYVTIRAC